MPCVRTYASSITTATTGTRRPSVPSASSSQDRAEAHHWAAEETRAGSRQKWIREVASRSRLSAPATTAEVGVWEWLVWLTWVTTPHATTRWSCLPPPQRRPRGGRAARRSAHPPHTLPRLRCPGDAAPPSTGGGSAQLGRGQGDWTEGDVFHRGRRRGAALAGGGLGSDAPARLVRPCPCPCTAPPTHWNARSHDPGVIPDGFCRPAPEDGIDAWRAAADRSAASPGLRDRPQSHPDIGMSARSAADESV
jgi:hypothetical protein